MTKLFEVYTIYVVQFKQRKWPKTRKWEDWRDKQTAYDALVTFSYLRKNSNKNRKYRVVRRIFRHEKDQVIVSDKSLKNTI